MVSGRPSDRAVNPHDSPGDTSAAARKATSPRNSCNVSVASSSSCSSATPVIPAASDIGLRAAPPGPALVSVRRRRNAKGLTHARNPRDSQRSTTASDLATRRVRRRSAPTASAPSSTAHSGCIMDPGRGLSGHPAVKASAVRTPADEAATRHFVPNPRRHRSCVRQRSCTEMSHGIRGGALAGHRGRPHRSRPRRLLAGRRGLLGSFLQGGARDQIREPQRRARIPFPPIGVCGMAAPTVPIGLVSLPKATEHVRPLRRPGELTHERSEHLGGARIKRTR